MTYPACPYCGSIAFRIGPAGGVSINVRCANDDCRHWFNWTAMLHQLDDLDRVDDPPRPAIDPMIVSDPNKLFVGSLWAVLSVDEHGNEGLCGHHMPGMGWIALVGADEARVASLRPIAKMIAAKSGMKVKLVKFAAREELEIFDGSDDAG